MNNELNDANKLALSIDKTNFVIFHSPKRPLYVNVTIKFSKQQSKKLARAYGTLFKVRHLPALSKTPP